jgi:transposase-like protein
MGDLKPKFCPFCKSEDLSESYESFVDYYEVGDTFRCNKCKFGFGYLSDARFFNGVKKLIPIKENKEKKK